MRRRSGVEELGGLLDDGEFGFKFADAPTGCFEFCRFDGGCAWASAVIDVVLADPLVQRDGVDVEFVGDLRHWPPGTGQGDSLLAELDGVSARQAREPSTQAFV